MFSEQARDDKLFDPGKRAYTAKRMKGICLVLRKGPEKGNSLVNGPDPRELTMVHRVIESMMDGYLTIDRDWRITYIHKDQLMPPGRTIENSTGKYMWDVFPETVGTKLYDMLHLAAIERERKCFELFSLYDHEWYEVTAFPHENGLCCLFKKITAQKRYEEELKRLSSLDLIGKMAAGISHEIRNPMTTVRGFLQIMRSDEQAEEKQRYFDLMIEELDRANSIISEFLSMGSGRSSKLEHMDLNTVVHDTVPLIRIDAHGQNKCLEVKTEPLTGLMLNRNEIRQLLLNLCRNGLEAMEERKTLTIRTYMEEGAPVLAIIDEGEGISGDILGKLGTPFFTTKDTGTGIGLGVCYAIANHHGAKVEIQTKETGTTFLVRFGA